jgi:hypothetical protein
VEKYVLPSKGTDPYSWDWKGAYKMLFNARWIGTERQAPDIRTRVRAPSLSVDGRKCRTLSILSASTSKPDGNLPWRRHRRFLLEQLVTATALYLLNSLYTTQLLPILTSSLSHADITPGKQTYLRRFLFHHRSAAITTRETLIRVFLAFHFLWSAYYIFTFLHSLFALAFVCVLGLDNPSDWPPLYGNPTEAYTIRRFWGKYWHRLVYRTYLGYATLISQKVLRIPRCSPLERLVVNFLVFLLSGAVHAIVTWRLEFRCGYWEDVGWFCLNYAAILVEEGVLWAIAGLSGGVRGRETKVKTRKPSDETPLVHKAVGFLWVFSFIFWSLPKSQFPKIACGTSLI